MKIFIQIILLLTQVVTPSYSQYATSGAPVVSSKWRHFECWQKFPSVLSVDLYLDGSGKYKLEFLSVVDDIVNRPLISYGNYVIKMDSLLLTDHIFFFKIKLVKLDDDRYEVVSGFKFLNGKTFGSGNYFNEESMKEIDYYFNTITHEKRNQKIAEFISANKNAETIKNGTFYEVFENMPLTSEMKEFIKKNDHQESALILSKDRTYQVKLENIILCEGTWTTSNAYLFLNDSTLNTRFVLLIKDDKTLINLYIPGHFTPDQFEIF